LPSAVALLFFAYGVRALVGSVGVGLLHGLKLVAVSIVAQAVFGMARTLCADRRRASLAVIAMVLVLYRSSSSTQIGVIFIGAVAGLILCRTDATMATTPMVMPISRRAGITSLATFVILLLGLPLTLRFHADSGVALFAAFYRSGALVFGGGHVVLPVLQEAFVASGWVTDDTFLAGYGAAQAVPGPIFTIAAYLGAEIRPAQHGLPGALIGLMGIFLPGMLLLVGTLPFWNILRSRTKAQAAMRGVNAAVVGLLAAALYTPLWTSSVHTPGDLGVVLVAFTLLTAWHARPLLIVIMGALSGIVLSQLHS
jgi:chromate transporter